MASLAPIAESPSARAADRAVAWLQSQGVKRVFGIPGGAVAQLFDALVDSDVEVVVCQHEGMAGYLACGEAQATGRPGVLLVTSGPGVLNAVTPVAAAFQDEIPLLVLAGDVRRDWAGRGALQDGGAQGLNIRSIFRSVTRFQDELSQPERTEDLLGRAWSAALQHPRGPALLRIPADVSGAQTPSVPEWRAESSEPTPDVAELERAAELLRHAERGAIFAGVGARSAKLGDVLERLAYRLRMPIITDLEAKSVVPETSPMCLGLHGLGQSAAVDRYLRGGVDVLLSVGARFDDTSTCGFSDSLRPSKALIQLDHDPRRIHRLWRAEVAVVGDLALSCQLLLEASEPLDVPTLLTRAAAVRDVQPTVGEAPAPMEVGPFDPASVLAVLQREWSDAMFLADVGNHTLFAARHIVTKHPRTFHASIGLGGMGSGIGTAMGMAAAGVGRPVLCVCGDGGVMMVGNELATAARYGIPLVLVVFDDGGLGMVRDGMTTQFGRCESAELPEVDLVQYARSLGAHGRDVKTEADLSPPERLDGPLVLRVPIDRNVRPVNPRLVGFVEARNHG